ncbi:MAG: hypothetical protein JJE47_15485, partial [Acidimicrobiia bacterium]|nr:hypothetical protein [Acidimicrobiia bacterium]
MKRQTLTVTGDLAAHLAEAGIASLRYDKRGVGGSEVREILQYDWPPIIGDLAWSGRSV